MEVSCQYVQCGMGPPSSCPSLGRSAKNPRAGEETAKGSELELPPDIFD